jgi:hypothetical protein
MLRNKWLYVQFNLAILFVIILTVYLAISITKEYPTLKLKIIDTLKSKFSFDKIFNTRHYSPTNECSECDRTNLSNYNINISKQVEYNQVRNLQFRTVDDAWNKDNTNIASYIKDGEKTTLLSPDFQVLYLSKEHYSKNPKLTKYCSIEDVIFYGHSLVFLN